MHVFENKLVTRGEMHSISGGEKLSISNSQNLELTKDILRDGDIESNPSPILQGVRLNTIYQ